MSKSRKTDGRDELMAVADAAAQDAQSGQRLDQIREILFGAEARESERRLSELELRTAALTERIDAGFASLESTLKAEMAAISARIDQEGQARTEALQQVAEELRAAEERLGDADTHLGARLDEVREDLLDRLEGLSNRLTGEKLDRSLLAGMFEQLAARLQVTAKPPSDAA